jgi:hypothetical protein
MVRLAEIEWLQKLTFNGDITQSHKHHTLKQAEHFFFFFFSVLMQLPPSLKLSFQHKKRLI